MMAEFDELDLDALSVRSLAASDGDMLDPIELDPIDARGSDHKVDYILEELARELDAEGMGGGEHSHAEPSTLESMAAFSDHLKESMAKFDEFLERSSMTGNSSTHSEFTDELSELDQSASGFDAQIGKRSRDQYQGPLKHMHSDVTEVSIRTFSGGHLSSMPMHHGYSTTSALDNQANWRSELLKPSQQNQTWDNPEPILGEVTGSKMRRLQSQNSYFHSHPSAGTEGIKNTNWALPTKRLGENQRAAMAMLMSGPAVPGGRTNTSGWPAPGSGRQMGGLTRSRASLRSTNLATVQENPTITSNASWSTPKPTFGTVSLEEMQRLANTGASFPSQAASATTVSKTQNAPSNASWQASKPAFGTVTLEDMQRLANTGASFPSQAASATTVSGTQNASASWQASKPVFGTVTLEDMQRLAYTGASFPSQAASATTVSGTQNASAAWQTPKPAFGAVTLEDMQRLANVGASFPSQVTMVSGTQNAGAASQTPKPAFGAVTLEDMRHRAHINGSIPSQAPPLPSQAPPTMSASNTPAFGNMTLEDMQRLARATAGFPFQMIPTASGSETRAVPQNASSTTTWHTTNSAFGNITMEDMQRLAQVTSASYPSQAMSATSESGIQAAPQSATSDTSWQTPMPAFGNLRMEDFQRLASASANVSSQTAPTTIESGTQAASHTATSIASLQTPAPASGNVSVASEGPPRALENEPQDAFFNTSLSSMKKMDANGSLLFGSLSSSSVPGHENKQVSHHSTPPQKVSGGDMQCLLGKNVSFNDRKAASQPSGAKNAAWPDPISDKGLPSTEQLQSDFDPNEMVLRLENMMKKSLETQKALEEFDKSRGLPRSHSQTMVNTSRSRKQLQEGKIIAKWDGSPLISEEVPLGKPKPRARQKLKGENLA